MLDTNAINFALDYRLISGAFTDRDVFITHVQRNELEASQPERRHSLLTMLKTIGPQQIPTESAVWGVSEWGGAKWTADNECATIFQRITVLDAKAGKSSTDQNRWRDALIAETAIKNGLVLITNDRNLTKAATENGVVHVITFEAFLQLDRD